MTKDYDLNALIGGSVESIVEKFDDLSDKQLADLAGLEKAQSSRTTLLDAIAGEQKARAEKGKREAGDGAGGGTTGTAAKGGGSAGTDAAKPVTFTQAQVDAMLAEKDKAHAEDKKLAVANAKGGKAPQPAKVPVPKPLRIHPHADDVSLTALTGPVSVVFVDDRDIPVAGLPPMIFEPKDFDPNGYTVTLKREVEFPPALSPGDIAGAFLLDDEDDPVGKATLVQPFAIGGGRSAKLGNATLQFGNQPASPAARAGAS